MGGSLRVPSTDACVEVGAAELDDGVSGLQVRRGSEPSLHQDTPPQRQVIVLSAIAIQPINKDRC